MQASDKNISSLLSEKVVFEVPIYQRNYEWKIQNCEKMLKEIINTEEYFLGIIVTFRDKKKNKKFLIDGQQRLTTFYLILFAIRSIFEDLTDGEEKLFTNLLFSENKIRERKPISERIKIQHNTVDNEVLKNIVAGKKDSGISRIEKNYLFIYETIESLIMDSDDIEQFISELVDKVDNIEIVELVLEEGDNPQQVFESLNSSGLKLNSAELIKNYILLNENSESQHRITVDYWDVFEERIGINNLPDFFRVFLSYKNKETVAKHDVYELFKTYFRNDNSNKNKLEEINFYIDVYCNIKTKTHSIPEIKNFLKLLDRLGGNVFYSFFFHLQTEYENSSLTKDDFIKIIEVCESFFLRRFICGLTNQAAEAMFVSLIEETGECYLENLISFLKNKNTPLNKFPSNKELQEGFFNNQIVSTKDYVPRYIFYRIEMEGKKEKISFESMYLKSIVPSSINREWRRTLNGDEESIRQFQHSLCNYYVSMEPKLKTEDEKSFNYKKENISKERFSSTNYLSQFDTWNFEYAWLYNEYLLEKFLEIWKDI